MPQVAELVQTNYKRRFEPISTTLTRIRDMFKDSSLDLDEAMNEQGMEIQIHQNGRLSSLPRVGIDHSKTGKHSLYLKYGENLEGESIQEFSGNQFECCIFSYQAIRAYWGDDLLPVCSAIEDKPNVSEPHAVNCRGCELNKPGTVCKAKIRLFLLILNGNGASDRSTVVPAILSIPATSIKNFQKYLSRAQNSGVPLYAIRTRVGLEDVKKNGWRWAVTTFDYAGILDRETFKRAVEARNEFIRYYHELQVQDEFRDYMQNEGSETTGNTSDETKSPDHESHNDGPLPF